jgi:hypothetical protein
MWNNVYKFETARFSVQMDFAPEMDSPDWDFQSEDDKAEIFRRIACGNLLWFVARVRVLCDGRVVGESYLGQCCYESAAEFLSDGYALATHVLELIAAALVATLVAQPVATFLIGG